MKRWTMAMLGAAAMMTAASQLSAGVIITEIMYNPATEESSPGVGEWVEIYNNSGSAVDISGWFLDDEDPGTWGAIPASTSLAAGQVAVLFDAAFTNANTFRTEWSVPVNALVIGVTWQALGNSPSSSDEILTIKNASSVTQDEVNYDDASPWPVDDGSASIYLTFGNLTDTANNSGSSWALSVVNTDFGRNPSGSTYNTSDVGSPGQIPVPEPATLGLIALGGLTMLARSRKQRA